MCPVPIFHGSTPHEIFDLPFTLFIITSAPAQINHSNKKEVIPIEVRINKEVRDYQESVFFGLSLRQLIFALLAVLVAVGVYFGLRNIVGSGDIGWMCILAAFPFAMGGFFTYNGMTFEKFLLALIRSELLYPKKLVFRSENLYAKALENSSIKEALHLD